MEHTQIITEKVGGKLFLKLPVRVYWEDTDAGGVVYHSQYLNFSERARTEWVRLMGIESQQQYAKDNGVYFVVKNLNIDYKLPAVVDDFLMVSCEILEKNRASIIFKQQIMRGCDILAVLSVTVVCINGAGVPIRMPSILN